MVKPQTLQQAVEDDLREEILNGEMPPGAAIAFDELTRRFGVSRVPVRDALRVLEGEGLVVSRPRHGYVVTELTVADLKDMQGIREVLEQEAIEEARGQLEESTFTTMQHAFEVMCESESSKDHAKWIKAHRKFHFAVFNLAQNRALLRMLHQLWNASDIYRTAHLSDVPARAISKSQHEELLAAVQSQDVDEVLRIMREHRGATVANLERVRCGHGE